MDAGKQLALAQNTKTMPRCMPNRCITSSISMVGLQLRCTDDDGGIYAPHYVPIGPYHLSRSSPGIDKEKMRSTGLLQSLSEEHTKAGLTGLMEELEPLARSCYADGAPHMTPEQFARMLLHDGCYLLRFFVDYVSTSDCTAPGDGGERRATTAPPVSRNTLVRDAVFLVENQIPLFVLERLHERVVGGGACSSVLECIAGPVQELLQRLLLISKKPRPAPPLQMCPHLLHLVHAYLQPTLLPAPAAEGCNCNTARRRRRRLTGRWRRATEYQRYANVLFKARELEDDVECSSVLDVQLGGGSLWIPRLRVDSSTWTVLRNLMALEEQEQAHRRWRPVTAYCVFMSQVACTAEDVELLRRAAIVDHFLGNDEQAARGFAGLCRGVVLDVDDLNENYLKLLWHELEERCHSRSQRLMGWFRHGHNMGIAAVLLVALILVACQVMQTFYAAAGPGRRH